MKDLIILASPSVINCLEEQFELAEKTLKGISNLYPEMQELDSNNEGVVDNPALLRSMLCNQLAELGDVLLCAFHDRQNFLARCIIYSI